MSRLRFSRLPCSPEFKHMLLIRKSTLSQFISTGNPLHKQSEKACMCFQTRCVRTYDFTVPNFYTQYWYYTAEVMLRFTNRVYFGSCILEVVEEEQVTDVNLKAWIQCLEEGHQIGIYVSNHTQTQVEGYVVVWNQFDWMNQTWTAEKQK